eukprot:5035891-Prymnesium_polylepis.1
MSPVRSAGCPRGVPQRVWSRERAAARPGADFKHRLQDGQQAQRSTSPPRPGACTASSLRCLRQPSEHLVARNAQTVNTHAKRTGAETLGTPAATYSSTDRSPQAASSRPVACGIACSQCVGSQAGRLELLCGELCRLQLAHGIPCLLSSLTSLFDLRCREARRLSITRVEPCRLDLTHASKPAATSSLASNPAIASSC